MPRFLLLLPLLLAGCIFPDAALQEPTVVGRHDLRSVVDGHVRKGFSGVVLVARGGEYLLFDGFGMVDGRLLEQGSRFWIASTGKQFTSAAILYLVDRGRLRLDDPISRFLPDVPEEKRAITVRQLLSHTSGLGQSYVSEEHGSREAAVAAMLAEPLEGAPGASFRYSNSNYQLAAAIVEVVSGASYAHFVEDNLWAPVGLTDTGFSGPETSSSVSPPLVQLPERLLVSHWGEQGLFSSAGDLLRWYKALRAGQLLSESSLTDLFSPIVPISEGQSALGWFIGTSAAGNRMVFTRGNDDFGANSLIYAYPDQDVVIVILTHAGDAEADISWSRRVHRDLEVSLGL